MGLTDTEHALSIVNEVGRRKAIRRRFRNVAIWIALLTLGGWPLWWIGTRIVVALGGGQ